MWRIAPNAGNLSRVWRVVAGLLLQTWGIYLAFGGLWLVCRSKRAQLFSRLEVLVWLVAPNAGKCSGVCCRFGRALYQVQTHLVSQALLVAKHHIKHIDLYISIVN